MHVEALTTIGSGAAPSAAVPPAVLALAARINNELPQTQCRRCGYPSCSAYAFAIATDQCDINRCPPGGREGVARLSRATGHAPKPLDNTCGREAPRAVAYVVEAQCIGCTLCITACPVDCIVGAPKRMHTIIEDECTGCELCVPACPVDCIALEVATPGQTGWAAWSPALAQDARARFAQRQARQRLADLDNTGNAVAIVADELVTAETGGALASAEVPAQTDALARKRALVEAALKRATRHDTLPTTLATPALTPKPAANK